MQAQLLLTKRKKERRTCGVRVAPCNTDTFCLYGHYSYARGIEIWNTQYVLENKQRQEWRFPSSRRKEKVAANDMTRTTTFCPINLFDVTMHACLPTDHETNAAQRTKRIKMMRHQGGEGAAVHIGSAAPQSLPSAPFVSVKSHGRL